MLGYVRYVCKHNHKCNNWLNVLPKLKRRLCLIWIMIVQINEAAERRGYSAEAGFVSTERK